MEKVENNTLDGLFKEIENSKSLLSAEAIEVDEKTKHLKKYIDENISDILAILLCDIDVRFKEFMMLYYYAVSAASVPKINGDYSNYFLLFTLSLFCIGEGIRYSLTKTLNGADASFSLKDSIRKLKHLCKENKKAKQKIKKLRKELEKNRAKYENKITEMTHNLFTNGEFYSDSDLKTKAELEVNSAELCEPHM